MFKVKGETCHRHTYSLEQDNSCAARKSLWLFFFNWNPTSYLMWNLLVHIWVAFSTVVIVEVRSQWVNSSSAERKNILCHWAAVVFLFFPSPCGLDVHLVYFVIMCVCISCKGKKTENFPLQKRTSFQLHHVFKSRQSWHDPSSEFSSPVLQDSVKWQQCWVCSTCPCAAIAFAYVGVPVGMGSSQGRQFCEALRLWVQIAASPPPAFQH